MASSKVTFRPDRRHLLLLVLLLVALYVVVPQLGSFHDSLKLLRHPHPGPLLMAVAATCLTYLLATGTYCLLAFKPLVYRRTLLVQLSSLFVNRVLPAGIGALGVNYLYLRRSQHSTAQAAAVVAANNFLADKEADAQARYMGRHILNPVKTVEDALLLVADYT